jgi:hypothetical protein
MLRTTTLAIAVMGLLVSAASADYSIGRQADTQNCRIVTTKPNGKWVVGPVTFKSTSKAEKSTFLVCLSARHPGR